jgi:molybdopterin-guanine dinucleotide biosynthesis protein A
MPFLNDILIERLLGSRENTLGVVPVHRGLIEPLAALYHTSLGTAFSAAIAEENFSIKYVLQKSPVVFLPVDDLVEENPNLFINFNSPEDIVSMS